MLDELWINSGLSGRRPLFLSQGSKDSRPSRWMVRQDRPAEGQLVKHPAVPPCRTHMKCEPPHSLHPTTSHHRTLTSHTIFIPSEYSSTLKEHSSNVSCFSTFSSNSVLYAPLLFSSYKGCSSGLDFLFCFNTFQTAIAVHLFNQSMKLKMH